VLSPTLEHRASVKRFVSLQFLNPRYSVGLLGWRISPSQGLYLYKHRTNTHALSGIRTHNPSFRSPKTKSTWYTAYITFLGMCHQQTGTQISTPISKKLVYRIWGSHGSGYEELHFLRYNVQYGVISQKTELLGFIFKIRRKLKSKLPFSLPIYIPSASPQSSSLSPEAGTIGQEWPQCQ
jgi:hypothetical protein